MKKIIPKFNGLKKPFFKSILETKPVDLAYYFVRGASENERILVREALENASSGYKKEAEYYIRNPDLFDIDPELRKRFSELEQKAG